MKILLIEDDGMLCEILQKVLENEGYAVDISSDGEEGLYLGLAEKVAPRLRSFSRGQPDHFRPS